MPRYYYGTVPVLAWILNHYFYGGVHYAWLAAEFYPMRSNPNSSNPYVIYGQLYAAWAWADQNDKFVAQLRLALRRGVDAHQAAQRLDPPLAERLRAMCFSTSVELFYPLVYRVDIERIPRSRRIVAGSGLDGSDEYLVPDINVGEFDLLFADNRRDPDFVRFVLDAQPHPGRASVDALLTSLEGTPVR